MISVKQRRAIKALFLELKKIHGGLSMRQAALLYANGVRPGLITSHSALTSALTVYGMARQRQKIRAAGARPKPRTGPHRR